MGAGEMTDNSTDSPAGSQEGLERLLAHYHELAELAGSLAHEIKNPLAVIRMNMDLLAEDFADADTRRERRARTKFGVVHEQCTRLEGLLNDFLKFARVRSLDLVPGNLNEQVESVLNFFSTQSHESGIRVLPHLDGALPGVLLDGETLYAALLNLVKNAIEAMPGGGHADGYHADHVEWRCAGPHRHGYWHGREHGVAHVRGLLFHERRGVRPGIAHGAEDHRIARWSD